MSVLLPRGQRKTRSKAPQRYRGAAADDEGHIRRMTSRGTIAVLVSLAVFFYLIRSILLPFILAGAIAYVATPGIDFMTRRTRLPRVMWVVAFFAVLVVSGGGLGYLAVPGFVHEAVHVTADLNAILTRALSDIMGHGKLQIFGQTITVDQLAANIMAALRKWTSQGTTGLLLAAWGFSAMAGIVLTLVVLFYFLVGGQKLADGIFALVPPHQRHLADRVWEHTSPVLKRYFIGIGVIVVYAMCASYVGLGLVLGLSNAPLLAVLTGLLEMIPVIGPIASALLAGLVALQHAQSVWNIFGFVVYATLLRLSIDEVVGPIVLGRATYIPPVMVIFCFLSGGLIFGITGIIMAVPVALTIRITLATLYDEFIDVTAEATVSDESSKHGATTAE